MNLTDYVTLGRSGLRVSPLCLGTMTFGTEWGFGSEEKASKEIFDRYLDAGGNFIDTADGYTGGHSEEMIGKFVSERRLRDRAVIATKFTFGAQPGNPNAGGNGRKNIYRALEGSLRRLQTDYVDLYYLHAWDRVTPVEEVVATLSDLVRAGKIRYYALSDTPAWYVARAQTLAEKEGKASLIALQLEYALTERNIEREHVAVAQELGLGICPWSPLAGGFLSGKYRRQGNGFQGEGRFHQLRNSGSPLFRDPSEKNWNILDVTMDVAKKLGKTPAQVALNWVATQPGMTSTILGATKLSQLDDNLGAIEFEIPSEMRKLLDETSAIEPGHPYVFFAPMLQARIAGGTALQAWMPAKVYPDLQAAAPAPAPPPAEAAKAGAVEK
jgi:aryl-alcohol dehydrogenase-like predicted oxidoreductase